MKKIFTAIICLFFFTSCVSYGLNCEIAAKYASSGQKLTMTQYITAEGQSMVNCFYPYDFNGNGKSENLITYIMDNNTDEYYRYMFKLVLVDDNGNSRCIYFASSQFSEPPVIGIGKSTESDMGMIHFLIREEFRSDGFLSYGRTSYDGVTKMPQMEIKQSMEEILRNENEMSIKE